MSKGPDVGLGLAAAFVTAVAVTGVSADPIAGKDLAESGVSSAMVSALTGSLPTAPTFPELAAEPSITEYSLRALLRSPHETMPHITFTPDQMDDIINYIMSLKPRH